MVREESETQMYNPRKISYPLGKIKVKSDEVRSSNLSLHTDCKMGLRSGHNPQLPWHFLQIVEIRKIPPFYLYVRRLKILWEFPVTHRGVGPSTGVKPTTITKLVSNQIKELFERHTTHPWRIVGTIVSLLLLTQSSSVRTYPLFCMYLLIQ